MLVKACIPWVLSLLLLTAGGELSRTVAQEPAAFTVSEVCRGEYAIKDERFAIWNGEGYLYLLRVSIWEFLSREHSRVSWQPPERTAAAGFS